jgi:hypothetical protein
MVLHLCRAMSVSILFITAAELTLHQILVCSGVLKCISDTLWVPLWRGTRKIVLIKCRGVISSFRRKRSMCIPWSVHVDRNRTLFMEHCSCWEAGSHSARQNILRVLWSPKICYRSQEPATGLYTESGTGRSLCRSIEIHLMLISNPQPTKFHTFI